MGSRLASSAYCTSCESQTSKTLPKKNKTKNPVVCQMLESKEDPWGQAWVGPSERLWHLGRSKQEGCQITIQLTPLGKLTPQVQAWLVKGKRSRVNGCIPEFLLLLTLLSLVR